MTEPDESPDAVDVATDLSPRTPDATARSARRRQRTWLPLVVLALVLVAGGVLVTQFLRSAVDYYCNVDEVGVRSGCDAGRRLRLQGIVQQGTIVSAGEGTDFVIAFNGVSLPVHYDGDPGGIFKECVPVIVHGTLDGTPGVAGASFDSDLVEVKHSNEYVAKNETTRLAEAEQLAGECAAGA